MRGSVEDAMAMRLVNEQMLPIAEDITQTMVVGNRESSLEPTTFNAGKLLVRILPPLLEVVSYIILAEITLCIAIRLRFAKKCKSCRQWITKSLEGTHGLCPQCFVKTNIAPAGNHQPNRIDHTKVCRNCNERVSVAESRQLWDGNNYCTTCIESSSRVLLQLTGKQSLSERLPIVAIVKLSVEPILIGTLIGVPGSFATLLFGLMIDQLQEAVEAVVTLLLISTPVFVSWSICTGILRFTFARPIVSVAHGRLYSTPMSSINSSLSNYTWCETQLNSQFIFLRLIRRWLPICRHPIIVLKTPSNEVFDFRPGIVVGYDAKKYDAWRGFLELASIPKSE